MCELNAFPERTVFQLVPYARLDSVHSDSGSDGVGSSSVVTGGSIVELSNHDAGCFLGTKYEMSIQNATKQLVAFEERQTKVRVLSVLVRVMVGFRMSLVSL